ncbi:MAG: hypothetical protein JWN55_1978 [Frankiales bacterium]|nr:hypothetical protein [Frankiales bacterium]
MGLVRRRFLWSTGQVRAVRFLATVEQVRPGTATLPVAALALLATTSCSSSGAQPTSLPRISTTSTATPTVPPQATANTSLALDAFVRFYFALLNVAFSTSDASVVRRWSDPICQTCNNYAKALDTSREEIIKGKTFDQVDVAAPPVNPSGTLVEVFGTIPARKLIKRNGTVVKDLPSDGRFHFVVNVIRTPSGWLVRGIKNGD